MRILLLTHSFNSLSQRIWLELKACGHEVSVELDIAAARIATIVNSFIPSASPAPVAAAGPCGPG